MASGAPLKVTALFDPNISEGDDYQTSGALKQQGLIEIIEDYNQRYGHGFSLANHAKFKKDLAERLAHKESYLHVGKTPDQQLDLLIVVDQMLTGFDSKWLNTLYLDKVLRYESIIQAFSRTNRLFGPDKPFGTVRYYRYPHSMERNINDAVKLYSGDKPVGLFVDQLETNLIKMNAAFADIDWLFKQAGVTNFEKLPQDNDVRGQFAKHFRRLSEHLEAAKIQRFTWEQLSYNFTHDDGATYEVRLNLDEQTYLVLALRYKELSSSGGSSASLDEVPFDISNHLTEIDTGKIDADYMNSRFDKFLKKLQHGDEKASMESAINELHQSFAMLTQEEQKFANIFLNDVQRGDVTPKEGKTFRDHIAEYMADAKTSQINEVVSRLGFEDNEQSKNFKDQLSSLTRSYVTEANLNEFGRFDELQRSVDLDKAKTYFEALEGTALATFRVNMRAYNLLKDFVLQAGVDLPQPPKS